MCISSKTFLSCTLVLIFFVVGFATAQTTIAGDVHSEPEAMYDVLVEGIRENSQKLKCSSLVWNKTEKRDDPNSAYPVREGIYRLWWDGERIAIKSDYDIIVGSEKTGWRKFGNEKSYKVYDGKEFRVVDDVNEPLSIGLDNKPTFPEFENWFEHIRWPGHGKSIIERMNLSKNKKEIQCNWSLVKKDGSRLAKRVFRNINSNEDTYEVEYYDLLKGCNLVCYEGYNNGKMDLRETTTLHQVSGGCWFPVETNLSFVYPRDSSTTTHRRLWIDLEKSSFNDISAIPDDIFEIKITRDIKRIIDHRFGNSYTIYQGEEVGEFLRQGRHTWTLLVRTGEPLPDFNDIKIKLSPADVVDKRMLICFYDMNQRPSRNYMRQLNSKAQELMAKDIFMAAIQASKVKQTKLDEWIETNNISFPVGMVADDEEKIRFTWGVRSLPWLILTDKEHIVTAEGFAVAELNEKISGDSED